MRPSQGVPNHCPRVSWAVVRPCPWVWSHVCNWQEPTAEMEAQVSLVVVATLWPSCAPLLPCPSSRLALLPPTLAPGYSWGASLGLTFHFPFPPSLLLEAPQPAGFDLPLMAVSTPCELLGSRRRELAPSQPLL